MMARRYITRQLKTILCLAAALAALAYFAQNSAQAAPQAVHVVFNPETVTLPSDGTTTVAVRVENVEDLYGLELDVLFDPTIVTVASIEPGDFLSADFVAQQEVDNEAGRAALAYTQVGTSSPRTGSGDVAVLTLRRTACLGRSPLQLVDVILSDNKANAIPHTRSAGTAQSGTSAADRHVTGTIFHDANGDGSQDSGEEPLVAWPVYLQRLSVAPTGETQLAFSDEGGHFRSEELACGRYRLWSQNGATSVLTQTVDIPVSTDVQVPSLPVTGTLQYPLKRMFLPMLSTP